MRLFITLYMILFTSFAGGQASGKQPPIDPEQQQLIFILAQQPSLLNLTYLQYIIGRPENERTQRGLLHKAYFWYGDRRRVLYELHQTEPSPGQIIESSLVMHLPDGNLTFKDLETIFGREARRFYDYRSFPTELYSFSPNTYLLFSSPQNSFRVQQVKIMYRGAPLPEPPVEELQAARQLHYGKALTSGQNKRWEDMVPPLMAHLKDHPEDGEARYMLAQSYAKTGHINEAIVQYKAALAIAGNNNALYDKCVLGLKELRVIPPEAQEPPKMEFQIVDGGQRIRAAGAQQSNSKNTSKKAP